MEPKERKHNKSGFITLSVLSYSDNMIQLWYDAVKQKLIPSSEGLIFNSKCLLLPAADGRFSFEQKKVAFGYQIIAFRKFGRETLTTIAANKLNSDLVLSHLCGTRNCCEPLHIIIETKAVNDERTHCHWCMRNSQKAFESDGIQRFLASGACPHTPQCASSNF